VKLGDNGGAASSVVDRRTTDLGPDLDHEPAEREPAAVRSLSVPLEKLQEHYDVVVVGSGYGGAIAAARLAAAGQRVCVLERGRELQPGEFPNTLWRGLRQFQWRNGAGRHGPLTALFDVRVNHDVNVLVGCGLGGTSLINAGVTMRPPGWVFDDERWPEALRSLDGAPLAPYFRRAERMLGVSPYPEDRARDENGGAGGSGGGGSSQDRWPRLAKFDALTHVAVAVGGEVSRPNLAVSFRSGPNEHGVEQGECQLCGDCTSGCNYGAKNAVTVNYLPLAVRHGAHVFTEAEVQTVLPSPLGGWTVSFTALADGRGRYSSAPSLFVRADTVVLAAGTFGSTEILFRSRDAGLAVSPRLGHAFSSNGDALAVAYQANRPVRGVGLGRTLPTPETAVGPCITGTVLVTDDAGPAASTGPAGGPHPKANGHANGAVNGSAVAGTRVRQDLLIQEGSIPGALRPLLPAALAVAAASDDGGSPLTFLRRLAHRAGTTITDLLRGSRGGASPADRTMTYLLMGDDGGDGRLVPSAGGVSVRWTGAGDHPIFRRGRELLDAASKALGAELIMNPLSTPLLHNAVLSTHPLGGCPMGDDGAHGVVDDRGRVFTGEGKDVHDGLLVADGAIVPRPLTVNPLLTISALAERASELLVQEKRQELGASNGHAARAGHAVHAAGAGDIERPPRTTVVESRTSVTGRQGDAERPGLRFTERMRGFVGPVADPGPAPEAEDLVATTRAGDRRGRADGTPIEIMLTVGIDDLPALLEDPSRPGALAGTVTAPALSPRRMRVVGGHFVLVREDPTHVDTWHMRYVLELVSEEGRRFHFEGTKFLHDRAGFDAWSDTTTLHVIITEQTFRPATEPDAPVGPAGETTGTSSERVTEAAAPATPVVAAGVLTIGPADLARLLRSMRVTGVESRLERLRWLARFDTRFLRSLRQVYGGPLDDVGEFPGNLRKAMPLTGSGHRKLRLPVPEPRWCDGRGRWHEGHDLGDDAWLRLVRYEGGRRGPVMLASGFSMSSTSFLVDTIDTNLVEHLVDKGYDVWLFDYRASIDLPSAQTSFTIDDVARCDWPAAVDEVLRVTGAGTVQVVGHCVGSGSLLMALAAGLQGVRSAVCMQFTLDMVSSLFNQVKAALGVGKALDTLSVRRLAPFRKATVATTTLDLLLRAVPMPRDERCGKAVCRWLNAIFGCTHRHEQLSDATHDQLDEMFGVGSLTALEHLATMARRQAAVDHEGADVYRPHVERLRLPILLVQGDHNRIFHHEGSLRTLRRLQEANGTALYERVVLPGYAHLDALIGRNAARDVFPILSDHLDRYNI
jgi:cholesterol oxidase